jgi:hypothetical protein
VSDLRLYAVTSGWDGPFQLAEVMVAADSEDAAVGHAEQAFSAAGQPVCRAKMRIGDLGALRDGLVAGPRRGEAPYEVAWRDPVRRCDPEPAG